MQNGLARVKEAPCVCASFSKRDAGLPGDTFQSKGQVQPFRMAGPTHVMVADLPPSLCVAPRYE